MSQIDEAQGREPALSDVIETLHMAKENPSIIPSAFAGDMLDTLINYLCAVEALTDGTDITHQPTTPQDLADSLKGVSAFLSAIGRDGMMGLVEQAIGAVEGLAEARELIGISLETGLWNDQGDVDRAKAFVDAIPRQRSDAGFRELVRTMIEHDGGKGSDGYHAGKYFDARQAVLDALKRPTSEQQFAKARAATDALPKWTLHEIRRAVGISAPTGWEVRATAAGVAVVHKDGRMAQIMTEEQDNSARFRVLTDFLRDLYSPASTALPSAQQTLVQFWDEWSFKANGRHPPAAPATIGELMRVTSDYLDRRLAPPEGR